MSKPLVSNRVLVIDDKKAQETKKIMLGLVKVLQTLQKLVTLLSTKNSILTKLVKEHLVKQVCKLFIL